MVENKSFFDRMWKVILYIIIIIMGLSCILPILYTLAVSFSSKHAVAAGQVILWPIGFNTNAYKEILKEGAFLHSVWISFWRVILAAIVNFLVLTLAAYPLSKRPKEFKPRNILMWVFMFFMLFQGGLIPLYFTMKWYGLINNVFGLVVSSGLPIFNLILMMNFFRNLPTSIEEAAKIDGANPWQILFQIIIPLSKAAIATIMLFTIVFHWNEFFHGMIFSTSPANYPLQTYIKQLVIIIDPSKIAGDKDNLSVALSNDTLNAAKIFITIIPLLVIYPFLQKYFVSGIVVGSVKE